MAVPDEENLWKELERMRLDDIKGNASEGVSLVDVSPFDPLYPSQLDGVNGFPQQATASSTTVSSLSTSNLPAAPTPDTTITKAAMGTTMATAFANKCDNCGGILSLDMCWIDEGDCVCPHCHTMQSRLIDMNAEWRYYGYDDNKNCNPTRVGTPTSIFIPKSSMGTVIGMENVRKNGYEFQRIRRYQMFQSMPYKERSLLHVMDSLNVNASNNGIPSSIIEDAKMMYKKISERKISRGDNRNGLIASSIYMSCKTNNVPRSAKEIAKMFNLNITTMTKGCKKFHDIMKMTTNSSNPDDFIYRFCSKLKRHDITPLCQYVIKKAEEYSVVSENAPPSIAAGCIYLCSVCCGLDITKKDIAKACEISEVTINKCYKKLFVYKSHLFPTETIQKYNI
jgi:transcription initiation factor TFIIB